MLVFLDYRSTAIQPLSWLIDQLIDSKLIDNYFDTRLIGFLTQGSAVSSLKLFKLVFFEKAASSNTGGQAIR